MTSKKKKADVKSDEKIDYAAKRKEVIQLWERIFGVCKVTVAGMENGSVKTSASLLKEINQTLKLSLDLINLYEATEAEEIHEELLSRTAEELDLPVFDD